MTSLAGWLDAMNAMHRARGLARTARARPEAPDSPLVDLASNDYLGLSRDPRVVAAAATALDRHGAGARSSRLVTGTHAPHLEVEEELTALTAQASALVFSSGYAANLAVLTTIGRPGTLIVADAHVHASLIDGMRLAKCPTVMAPHNDVDAVAAALAARQVPRALVVVESIYSVLGDAADLAALAAVCETHGAWLVVDEAHGIGVSGGGSGRVRAAGLAGHDRVIATATLSKALGAQGGAVLGPVALREHLINTARSFIFDTGLSPASAAAAAEACRIVAGEPDRTIRLAARAHLIASTCGIPPAAGAVQSVPVRDAVAAVAAADELERRGVLVGCFRSPATPDGVSRLRLCANAQLPRATVAAAARAVATVARAAG